MASITYENSGVSGSSKGTVQLGASPGVAAGDLIVAVLQWGFDSSSGATVSDGTSSFTMCSAVLPSSPNRQLQVGYLLSSVATGNPTYTATYPSGASGAYMSIWQFRPSGGTMSLDGSFQSTTQASNLANPSSPSINTSGTDVVIGAGQNAANAESSPLIGGSAAASPSHFYDSSTSGAWYQIYSTSQSSINAACTASADKWICGIVAFQCSGGLTTLLISVADCIAPMDIFG